MYIIKQILILGSIFLAGVVFMYVRNKIKNRTINVIKDKIQTNCTIGKVYRKDGKEIFSSNKFKKMFSLFDGVEWIKSIKEILDGRKIIIYGLVIMTMFAYGWYKGKQNTPVKIDIGYGKSAILDLDKNSQLHIDKKGNVFLEDKKGKVLKQLSVKDIPKLKRDLAPIGFTFEPIGILGGGLGEKGTNFEAGAGLSYLRYWNWNLDTFLTNKGIYPFATSYDLTQNSAIGLGVGKGWRGDNRIITYYRWLF